MIQTLPCPPDYARLCAEGWDTVQEAFCHKPSHEWGLELESAKLAAKSVRDDLSGIVPLQVGPELMHMHATGAKGGFSYRLEGPDFLLMIGSPRREWTISVRYLSAGLWAHGLVALRERVFAALDGYTTRDTIDCVRVSRADWCFDFFSPDFSREFSPGLYGNVVAHSSVKSSERMVQSEHRCADCGSHNIVRAGDDHKQVSEEWMRAGHGETLTTGAKDSLQIQLYDKTKEITDVSGKEWLYEVWRRNLGSDPWPDGEKPRNVWRLELRWASDYLKQRNLRRPFEVTEALPALIAEAVVKRRLAVPNGDGNRSRWPMHPLWSEALRNSGADFMAPLGRRVTGARSALLGRARKQIAGSVISAVVLDAGGFDLALVDDLWTEVQSILAKDPRREKKVDAAMDRYSNVEVAR
jgi:outer membrane murein-binding lipoprotein Lpp/alkylated DNA repair dioxygenase AlkB